MIEGDGHGRNKTEQFRATRTWNMIVSAVCSEMPTGRRRKGFRIYENCFAGNEAVSWTINYLEQHRDVLICSADNQSICKVAITREKVTLLLQKLVEQRLISNVCGRQEAPFRDSYRCLYSFNNENTAPVLMFKTTTSAFKNNRRIRKNRNGSLHKVGVLMWWIGDNFYNTTSILFVVQ